MELKARCALREIKFRGKRHNGEWIHGALIPADCSWWGVPSIANKNFRYEVYEETVGQYTGIMDSEENEIYEGDIISFPYRRRTERGVVYFNDSVYRVKNKVNLHEDRLYSVVFYNEIHVIGNIHDNPEMVRDGKEE